LQRSSVWDGFRNHSVAMSLALAAEEGSEAYAYYYEKLESRRVLRNMPGKPPRNPDGSFNLSGQYWDGGLPCAVKKLTKINGQCLCKKHMMGEPCHAGDACRHVHLALEDRPACIQVLPPTPGPVRWSC